MIMLYVVAFFVEGGTIWFIIQALLFRTFSAILLCMIGACLHVNVHDQNTNLLCIQLSPLHSMLECEWIVRPVFAIHAKYFFALKNAGCTVKCSFLF